MRELTKTPFVNEGTWIKEKLGNGYDYKFHSNGSLLRLLNRQYREIESLKAQIEELTNEKEI